MSKKNFDANLGRFKTKVQSDYLDDVMIVVNVKTHGAVGDGVTDDSTAIRLASEECIQNGGILYFPHGVYKHETYQVPSTVIQIHASGEIIQPDNSFIRIGSKKPVSNIRVGSMFYDNLRRQIYFFDGDEWRALLKDSQNIELSGNLTVRGNMTVLGDRVSISTQTLEVADNIITLNKGVAGTPVLDSGIEVERGDEINARVIFDETADKWKLDSGTGELEEIASEPKVAERLQTLEDRMEAMFHDGGTLPDMLPKIWAGTGEQTNDTVVVFDINNVHVGETANGDKLWFKPKGGN